MTPQEQLGSQNRFPTPVIFYGPLRLLKSCSGVGDPWGQDRKQCGGCISSENCILFMQGCLGIQWCALPYLFNML